MTKNEFRNYLFKLQEDIAKESKDAYDVIAVMTYRCTINLLEEIIQKFDTIND